MSRWLTGWRIYTQIADRLRARIREGTYPAGSYLPSETALATEFHVARNTVRRALEVLEQENLIAAIASKGRIVLGEQRQETGLDREHLYQAVAAEIREQITRGDLVPGARLPGELTLARHHRAARSTIRQALAELEREGLIVAVHGKGRFVVRRE